MDDQIPLLSVRYARHFLAFLESRGIGRKALLDGAGIDEATLADPDGLLSMQQVECLVRRAQTLLPDERIPFLFGQQLDLTRHGLLGFAFLKQSDRIELVRMVLDYIRVGIPILDLECSISGKAVSIRLNEHWDTGDLRAFFIKIYMGSMHSLMSKICTDFSIVFDFPSELKASEWAGLINNGVIAFNAGRNEATMLLSDEPVRNNHDDITHYLGWLRAHESAPGENSLEVVRCVRQQITHNPGRQATLDRVAQKLGMSARSLRRHLQMVGMSFNGIRNEIRRDFATRYIIDTRVPLEHIAHQLGYSDQASFTRAYRAWTGRTPGQVRRDKGPETRL